MMMMIEILDLIQIKLNFPSYGFTIGFIIGLVQLIYVMARTLNFAYYFYIDHGFILILVDVNKEKINKTLKKQGKKKSMFAKGYPRMFLSSIFFLLIWMLILDVWYITLPIFICIFFLLMPVIIIKSLARKKRNKVVFEQKLGGTYPNELN